MSYQVIARKWRPQAFDEVTGQEHVTKTLRNAIEHDRLHHAYIFSGARGVGKTTTARLLAKALNCRKTDGPNVEPCRSDDPDQCASCREIAESRSLDVLEFDAASNTQVDKIREIILDSINIGPARDRNKIFIIDEVHMLSTSSFNALLKTVEEPPPNVAFIMATTELRKVPETIRSRCQAFQFRTISLQKIFERLRLIAEADGVEIGDDALREIARSGEGSMRDAQSNFDQVISFAGTTIATDDVGRALGLAGREMLVRSTQAVIAGDAAAMLTVVEELNAAGHDLRNYCRDLMALFRDLMVFKVAGPEKGLVDGSMLDAATLKELSDPFSSADILRIFNVLAETENSLKDAARPRYIVEAAMVRLTELKRMVPVETLLERLALLESRIGTTQLADAPNAAAATAGSEEKKTLNKSDTAAPAKNEMPDPPETPDFSFREPESFDDVPAPDPVENARIPDVFEALPTRLVPRSSEELEHVEDQWLDSAYELKLERSGDDLMPIAAAKELVVALTGETAVVGIAAAAGANAAPTREPRDLSAYMPAIEEEEELPDPGPVSDDIDVAELVDFAKKVPAVRRVMKMFRAEVIDARRSS